MNIILAIKPDYAASILSGIKTVELRTFRATRLNPGDTIFLITAGRIVGHCTYAGADTAPPPGPLRDKWLAAIATPAAIPTAHARAAYATGPAYAWRLRYPVTYGPKGQAHTGPRVQKIIYTTTPPHITHPSLKNYLLYLRTHKTP